MLSNHAKVAVRNFCKNKGFSSINVLGLALGMASSLLIFLWIQDESSKDQQHVNKSRLYKAYEVQHYDGRIEGQYTTSAALYNALEKEVPEVEMAAIYYRMQPATFSVGNKAIKQDGASASKHFFSMFSFPMLEGKAADALSSPESIAISKAMAERFYGSVAQAMNKTIRLDNKRDFTVKAVFENVTRQSSLQFDYVCNWDMFEKDNQWAKEWGNTIADTYVLFRADANIPAATARIRNFINAHRGTDKGAITEELGLQPFSEVYLHSVFDHDKPVRGRIAYIKLFTLVALFILVIACINFMNLTTARSEKRAKEIGVRKVIGAGRSSIIFQFMGEAVLIAVVAALLALLMVCMVLPFFNQVTGKSIASPVTNLSFLLSMLVLTLVTGGLSGSYPALFLSGFNPVRVLKGGATQAGPAGLLLRKSLVVFQFVLSIVLIIATLLITRQVNYVQHANLGYNRENLLLVPFDEEMSRHLPTLVNEVAQLPGVKSVAETSDAPVNIQNRTLGVEWPGRDPDYTPGFTQLAAGFSYIKTMNLELVKGRDFSPAFTTDSGAYIVNEEAVRKMGVKNPIGMPLTFWGRKGPVIGVVKDFHYRSLHEPITPLIMRMSGNDDYSTLLVRTLPGQTRPVVAGLEKLWKETNPLYPFTYRFLSDEYSNLYRNEEVIRTLSNVFAILAILISCLGLLGLTMFTAEQRTKEFGVRKVLGAGFMTLCRLLLANFFTLVIIAFLIAAPIAWWAMHQWLQQFAYHTSISWWLFAAAGVASLLVALVTVCFQAIKVARANPLKSLKTE